MNSVLDDDLYWQFSLVVYRQKGVASSCLALQARIGLEVNVLLMALLAARWHQRVIGRHEVEQADALVLPWRRDIVVPLRELRSRLKLGPAPAPDVRTDTLRNQIKATELQAERIEQQELAKWIDALAQGPGEQRLTQADDCQNTATHVVDFYLDRASHEGDRAQLYSLAGAVAAACIDYQDAHLLPVVA